jgi:urease accessory protein
MIIEKVIGKLSEDKFKEYKVDYIDIEWDEAFKKLHKKTSQNGREVAIRLGNEILTKGLNQGDVLAIDDDCVVAVNITQCEALVITVEDHHVIPKICYEIGNKHAALLWGENHHQLITPYNEPMKIMLEKLNAKVEKRNIKLDFSKSISSSINSHTH